MKKLIKAFTLVELLVVIAILGILSAVGIVSYSSFTKKAKEAKYAALARQAFDGVYADTTATLEDGSMFFVRDDEEYVAWFEYNDGSLVKLDSEPTLDLDHAFPLSNELVDYIPEGVDVYRPLVKNVVRKLNNVLDVGTAQDDYSAIADAGKSLSDIEMAIINWGRRSINLDRQQVKYSFAYDRDNNTTYIVKPDGSEVLFVTDELTTVPTKYRFLTGANINNEEDLLEFSKVTNEWTYDEDNYSRPNSKNYYMAHTVSEFEHSPIVVMNLNNDVDMSKLEILDEWEAIANWYCFTYRTRDGTYCNCYDISLLVNGNDNKFYNISKDVMFGALKNDSILRDFELVYNMGSSDKFYDLGMNSTTDKNTYISDRINGLKDSVNGRYWNYAIAIRSFRAVQSSSYDNTIRAKIENIKLSGNCYVCIKNCPGGDFNGAAIIGLICHEVFDGEGNDSYRCGVDINNCNIFASDSDNYYQDEIKQSKLYYHNEGEKNYCSGGNFSIDGGPKISTALITFN